MQAIETKGLTKFYGKARGVEGLSLSVDEGAFFGFIGPNGAGKSTTIRTLLGLIRVTAGESRVFGMDPWKEREKVLREVGYLPSENAFYSGMRADEVIRFSAKLRGKDCAKEAAELAERLQLDTAKKASELSFGNRKKLAIVCALQHKPRLLILDEPTGGLDPLMQREFFGILRERNAAGTTVFFSSHVLSEVQQNCDRIGVIRDGRLIACEAAERLSGTGAKRVVFCGTAEVAGLPGVRNLVREGESVSFLYDGGMDALVRTLAAGSVRDLTIREPGLEEIFLHYYEEA
ncbi:MAG: ABC transporter ATP-binding protein [Clostridia bacterium]|nr:ABC transporter ATP-binding protein [Clostridia bacterium]